MNNPFTLMFGKKPENYILRLNDENTIIESFNSKINPQQVFLITGIRGSGKTVLLTSIYKKLEEENDWIVVDLVPSSRIIDNFASELYSQSKIKKISFSKELSISFKGLSISLKNEDVSKTPRTLISNMLDIIKDKNKKVLITIDEVISDEYVREFIREFQSFMRKDYPIFLLMTGLYDNISKLQDDKSLTFLYRAPKIYLSSLNINAISNSYSKLLGLNKEDSKLLASYTNGYAYAYQVLGYIFYEKVDKKIDDNLLNMYDQILQEYVYDKVWSELTNVEKKILQAFNSEHSINCKEIIDKLGMTNSYFSNYRDRLIKRGVLTSPSYGSLQVVLPRFINFISYKEL